MALRLSLRSLGTATLLWMLPGFAHAQSPDLLNSLSLSVTWAIAGMNLGIWIVFTMLTQLLDTSMFLDEDMLKILNQVWVLSRNLVNIAFAVILIGAAVYVVVTAKKEFIAEHLKKFVLAVILVNFSWFIPRVIIDVSNIAAATIFNIPSLIGGTNVECVYRSPHMTYLEGDNGDTACTAVSSDPWQYDCPCAVVTNAKFFVTDEEAEQLPSSEGWNSILGNTLYIRLANLNTIQNVAPSSVVLNGLIINHARLVGLASVPPSDQKTGPKALVMFLLKEVVVLLLHIALFFPLAAMLLAFAIRIPVLWLTIAFMPFTVLQYVLPENIITEYPKKIMSNFISAAFLPAKVGIPLTIGFIMVNAGQQADLASSLKGIPFKLTDNISDYWELLWLVMVLGIIWEGVFETLKGAGIMGKFSENIKGAGESLGRIAIKAPLHVPLPGLGSPLSMMRKMSPRNIESAIDNSEDLGGAFDRLRGGGGKVDMAKSAREHAKDGVKMDKLSTNIDKLADAIKQPNIDIGGRNTAIETIKNDLKIDIRPDHASEDLKSYRNILQQEGATTEKLNAIDKAIDNLVKAEDTHKKTK